MLHANLGGYWEYRPESNAFEAQITLGDYNLLASVPTEVIPNEEGILPEGNFQVSNFFPKIILGVDKTKKILLFACFSTIQKIERDFSLLKSEHRICDILCWFKHSKETKYPRFRSNS